MRIFLLLWMVLTAGIPPLAAQEQPPARVVVREAGREVVAANRPYIGLLAYDRTSQVSTEVAGLVDRVFVREGDRIKAGDPLVSLFVSVSVIPAMIHQLYRRKQERPVTWLQKSTVGPMFAAGIMRMSSACMKNTFTRLATVVFFTSFSLGLTYWLMPSAEYLPQGNRNLILNIMIPPPGYSVDKLKEMGREIFRAAEPYFKEDGRDGIPRINQIFYIGADRINLFGGLSEHETRAREMIPLFNRIIHSFPGMFGVSIQASIFEQGLGQGRNIDVNISGENIDRIIGAARTLFGMISEQIADVQIRPVPSLETSYPEVRLLPDKEKLAANGLSEEDLGIYADILMDGRKIDDYRPGGRPTGRTNECQERCGRDEPLRLNDKTTALRA